MSHRAPTLAETLPPEGGLQTLGTLQGEVYDGATAATGAATASGTDREASDPLVGAVVDGRYEVLGRIGEGGMGRVYRALHRNLGRTVALKVLSLEGRAQRRALLEARFLREARILASLAHPNVVEVLDFGLLEGGEPYYVMEFLAGETLADWIADYAPMPAERIRHVAAQVASGMAAAHAAGVVHRDLKPENILLVSQGGRQVAKVVDFGIAKLLEAGGEKLTQTGIVTGTPHYVSPEQARGDEVDPRSDVYSLGVVLYEMAVGEAPFEHREGWMALIESHLREAPVPPSARGVALGGLEAIVLRCLEKDPWARYADMEALGRALAGAEKEAELGPPPPAAAPADPAPSRRPGLRATLAGLLGGVLAAALWLAAAFGGGAVDAPTGAVHERREQSTRVPERPLPSPPPSRPAAAPTPPVEALPWSPVPPPATRVVSTPEGAEVFVDGVLVGNAPLSLPRPALGRGRPVVLRLPGRRDEAFVLEADSPETLALTLSSERRRARPAAPASPSPPPAAAPPAAPRRPVMVEDVVDPWER